MCLPRVPANTFKEDRRESKTKSEPPVPFNKRLLEAGPEFKDEEKDICKPHKGPKLLPASFF